MNKWLMASYLITAKKSVDSIIYINEKRSLLKHVDIYKIVDVERSTFYINCCILLDKTFKNKKELCSTDKIAERLYYERDKNYAHKDSDYERTVYDSLAELSTELRNQLKHVKEICKGKLPSVITLDFVSHDPSLFRLVNGVTVEKEDLINQSKYIQGNNISEPNNITDIKIVHEIQDIKNIDKKEIGNYGTILKNGINEYEGIQNRQDFSIITNFLFNKNMWVTVNSTTSKKIEELKKLGLIDEYNRPQPQLLSDPVKLEKFKKIADEK